jgi:hypothetical protein
MHQVVRIVTFTALAGVGLGYASVAVAAEMVYPVKDGTLADGGVFGTFDGIADDYEWAFGDPRTGYEGTITLLTETPESSLEHRVVWEYDLSAVTLSPPVSATLTFTIRGAPVYPFPDVDVHVYAYPADLQESPDDYHAGPAVLQGSVSIGAYQDPTVYSLNVSQIVSQSLLSGDDKVAFRLQIDPDTLHDINQAFIDAIDSDPATKPFLTIDEAAAPPGDADGDQDVDLDDYRAMQTCFTGPDGVGDPGCELADLNDDGDIDFADFAGLQVAFTGRQ